MPNALGTLASCNTVTRVVCGGVQTSGSGGLYLALKRRGQQRSLRRVRANYAQPLWVRCTLSQPDITGALPLQDTNVSASLYVANLPSSAEQAMLAGAFAEFGTVLSVRLKREAITGSERCFGFVEMKTTAEARAAARAMNATRFEGRLLSVWRVARS